MSEPSEGLPATDPPAADGSGHAETRQRERLGAELSARSYATLTRGIGSPVLFGIVYTSLASTVFFSLGVLVNHALGLTPLVFLIAAMMFGLTAMTYVEGASLHQEPGGSTVFARYAFNELVSFIAGWAILLDYVILIAVAAYAATRYLQVFWHPLGNHLESLLLALGIIAFVVLSNLRGFSARRGLRIGVLVVGAIVLVLIMIGVGLVQFFNPHTLTSSIHLGSAPTWSGLIFALTITTMAFTSVESASGLAGEVRASRAALRRLVSSGTVLVLVSYVGTARIRLWATATWTTRWWGSRRVCTRTGWRRRCATRWGRSPRRRWWRQPTRRCWASRGWRTRSRPTARSPAASAGCTRSARRRSW
jgi:hypothetical protein